MHLQKPQSRLISIGLILLLSYGVILGLYWIMRYKGWSVDIDTIRMSEAAEGSFLEGKLAPSSSPYHAGYGFPSLLVFLSHITNLPIQTIQLNSGIWLSVIVLGVFICYRELLGRPHVALIATFLLLLLPDFLFYVLRSSHEKTTWLFAVLMLLFLSRSLRATNNLRNVTISIILFYLLFWAMIANNVYFASTFMTTFVLCFGGGMLVNRRLRQQKQDRKTDSLFGRLLLTSIACFVLVFVFVMYTYEPAMGYFFNLSSLIDRLSALFFGAEIKSTPYQSVQAAWRPLWIYPLLTGAQWLITLGSGAAWLIQTRDILRKRQDVFGSPQQQLIWLMYTAFGLQLALGIFADFAGFLSGNLQVRLFVPFTLFISPMAALFIDKINKKLRASWRRRTMPLAIAAASFAVVAALLKITNDPLVSNQWQFSLPAELHAGTWTDQHLQDRKIWAGTTFSEDTASRQFDMLRFQEGYDWDTTNSFTFQKSASSSFFILSSQLTLLQANRSSLILPGTVDYGLVYDNGDVQLYHRRSITPYQK